MCGISGYFGSRGNRRVLEQMTNTLRHRGPDAFGYYLEKDIPVGLGHRRLSIIDCTVLSNQPFLDKSGNYVISFNGEIYNFQKLKAKYNIETRTNSDTEVLVEGFARWGLDFIQEIHGMFAMAILDRREKVLWLFRDRVGIKPLYYCFKDDSFYFASELKAITSVLKPSVDKDSIATFMHLGYMPGQDTFFSGVKKLLPGTSLTYNGCDIKITSYWNIESKEPTSSNNSRSLDNEIHKLSSLIRESVGEHLVADVPVGCLLSGGIDSSLVTANAVQLSPKKVKTFTIGFKNSKFDESDHARRIANYLNTEHYEFILTEENAIERVYDILNVYDEPFGDLSVVPTMLVSKLASEHVKVVLTGDGGDELFLGYGMYQWAKRMGSPFLRGLRWPIRSLLRRSSDIRHRRAANYFDFGRRDNIYTQIFSQEQNFFTNKEIDDLLLVPKIESNSIVLPTVELKGHREQQALLDILNYLPEDLLLKVDRATMSYGLEARVPLLDHRIVEYAVDLPEKFKVSRGTTKFLLKKVLSNYIPNDLVDRPKWGFSIPMNKWMAGPLFFLIEKYLNKEVIEKYGIVRWDRVKSYIERFVAGESYLHSRLWLLIILHQWFIECFEPVTIAGDLQRTPLLSNSMR